MCRIARRLSAGSRHRRNSIFWKMHIENRRRYIVFVCFVASTNSWSVCSSRAASASVARTTRAQLLAFVRCAICSIRKSSEWESRRNDILKGYMYFTLRTEIDVLRANYFKRFHVFYIKNRNPRSLERRLLLRRDAARSFDSAGPENEMAPLPVSGDGQWWPLCPLSLWFQKNLLDSNYANTPKGSRGFQFGAKFLSRRIRRNLITPTTRR